MVCHIVAMPRRTDCHVELVFCCSCTQYNDKLGSLSGCFPALSSVSQFGTGIQIMDNLRVVEINDFPRVAFSPYVLVHVSLLAAFAILWSCSSRILFSAKYPAGVAGNACARERDTL